MALFLLCLASFLQAKDALPTQRVYVSAADITPTELVSRLAAAKRAGDEDLILELQSRIDELAGVGEAQSIDCATRVAPLRHLPEGARAKSFGSDVYAAASTNFEGAPAIDCASSGEIFLAYEARDSEHPHKYIAVIKSTDGGETWFPLIQIANDYSDLNYPQLVVGEGEQDWVFVSYHTSGGDVQVARFSFSGAAGEARSLDGTIFTSKFNARITVDGDYYYYVYVAYIRSGLLGSEVHVARSTDFGTSWSIIDPTSEGAAYCDIANTGGSNFVLVTQTGGGEESGIWTARSTDYCATWGSGTTVASSGAYPRVAGKDGNAAIVYVYKYSDSDHDIYSAISTDHGASWATHPVVLTYRDEKFADVDANDAGFLLAYWEQGKIRLISRPFGGGWGVSSDVSDEATAQATFPSVGVLNEAPGGCPVVAWEMRFSDTDHDILFDKNCCDELSAGLYAFPTEGVAPLDVLFRDESSGLVESRVIYFGDGETSEADSVVHTYDVPGTYTAKLVASNFCMSDTAEVTINVLCPELSCRLWASVLGGTAPLTVTFADSSTGFVSERHWDFGDGGTASDATVEHTFTEAGTYTVTLVVSDPCGSSDTATTTVWVYEPVGPLVSVGEHTLDFGEVGVGHCASLQLSITNIGDATLVISGFGTSNPSFVAPSVGAIELEPGEWDTVEVQFCPTDTGYYDEVLTIYSNDSVHPDYPVWLRGTGVATPDPITVTPAVLEFDSVGTSECETKRITVRNNGDEPVAVTGLTLYGSGAFSIVGHDTFTVYPGSYRYITIKFCPGGVTSYAGTLIVHTEVGDYTVSLLGLAYDEITCIDYGSYQICSNHIDGNRVYGDIRLVNSEGDTVARIGSVGDLGAYIDLSLDAGTGLARFVKDDGSIEYVYGGAFDLTYTGLRFRFDPSTSMLPDSIRERIIPDSLLGAPFSFTASLDPAIINVDYGWWQISGDISINWGGFSGAAGVYRRCHRDGTTEYYVDDFELGLWDNAFQFKFRDVYVVGDTLIAGRLYLKLNSSLIPSTSLIDGGYFSIDARSIVIFHGRVIDMDLALTFPDLTFPVGGHMVAIRRAMMRLVWEDGEVTRFSGGGRFEISGLLPDLGSDTYIGAYVTIIRDVGLDDVRLEFMGWSPGIPLGTTGFFLTGIAGEVRHITDPANLYVEFGCQLSGGPSVPYFGSVVRMEPTVWIDLGEDEFGLEGTVRFLEHLARGEAGFIYDWNYGGGGWALMGYANLRAGITDHIWARGGTELAMWREPDGDFHLTGDAGVEVHIDHHAIAWLFPTHDIEVEGRVLYGEFRHGGDSGGHWGLKGEAYINFFGLHPSFAYIDGHVSLLGDAEAYTPMEMRRLFLKSHIVTEELRYEIGSTDMNLFILRTAQDVRPTLSVELPDGRVITRDSCSFDEADRYVWVEGYYDGHLYQGMMIKENAPGEWVVRISDLPAGDTDHLVQAKGFHNPLALSLEVSPTPDGFRVSGDVLGATPDDTVFVTLMLKPNDIEAGPAPVAEITLAGEYSVDTTFSFAQLGFMEGDYHIIAYAEDKLDRFAMFVDSSAVVSVPADDVPPSPPTGAVAAWVDDETVRLAWMPSSEPDVAGYKVYKGWLVGGEPEWWETIDVADVTYYLFDNAKVMVPETLEFVFGLSAYDNSGNESAVEVVVPAGADPSERDTVPPSVAFDYISPNLEERTLTVSWHADEEIYAYVLAIGTAPGEITYKRIVPGSQSECTFEKLAVGADYYLSIIAVDMGLNYSAPESAVVAFYDVSDADGDGLPDWWEEFYFGDADSCDPEGDADGDLVSNRNEYLAGTDPNDIDSDGDGVPDLSEIASPLLDPNDASDADGDRLPDDWEEYFFGTDTLRNLANLDSDGDGLSNLEEYEHRTDPHDVDTDGGGLRDGDEVQLSCDPNDPADDDDVVWTIHLSTGWNMISLPVQPPTTSWRELFPSAIEAYTYDPVAQTYYPVDELEIGRGYWLLSLADMDVSLSGVPVFSYTLSCGSGWNMVAAPMVPTGFPASAIETDPADVTLPPTFWFDGTTYISTPMLEPGKGYWLLLTSDCVLTVDRSAMGWGRGVLAASGELPPPPPSAAAQLPEKLGMTVAPTPFNSATQIRLALPQAGDVAIAVYDCSGHLVRTLYSGWLEAGSHTFRWDGTSAEGTKAQSGVYIIRAQTPTATFVRRAVYVR